MQQAAEITFRDMDRSEALADDILSKVKKLEEICQRIGRCRVLVEAPHRHHHQGKLYRVRIQLSVPRRELVVGHESHDKQQHEDPYVAVRDAFSAMRRQLQEYVRELRRETKSHDEGACGSVARIYLPDGPDYPERGYGFISMHNGREVYFHANSLVNVDFPHLEFGSEVEFVEEEGDDGPQASSVRLVRGQYHLVE